MAVKKLLVWNHSKQFLKHLPRFFYIQSSQQSYYFYAYFLVPWRDSNPRAPAAYASVSTVFILLIFFLLAAAWTWCTKKFRKHKSKSKIWLYSALIYYRPKLLQNLKIMQDSFPSLVVFVSAIWIMSALPRQKFFLLTSPAHFQTYFWRG
jgi:hypothetical protein